MSEETSSNGCDGFFSPISQLIKRMCALFMSSTRPFLQPALCGFSGLHSRLVTEQPQQHKVGVHLAVHHGFQVEFDVGLPREAHIVPQKAQPQSIRDQAQESTVVAVKDFLHEAMRAAAESSG